MQYVLFCCKYSILNIVLLFRSGCIIMFSTQITACLNVNMHFFVSAMHFYLLFLINSLHIMNSVQAAGDNSQ